MTLLISSLARLLVSARTDLPDMVLAGRERLGERARRVLLALRGGHTRARPLTHSHTQTLTHTLAHIHTHTQSLVPPRAQGPVRKRRAAAARSRGSSAAAAAGSAASGRCCRGAAVRAFPPTRGRRPRPPAPGGGGEGHMATPGSGHAGAVGRTCARTLTRRPQVPGVPRGERPWRGRIPGEPARRRVRCPGCVAVAAIMQVSYGAPDFSELKAPIREVRCSWKELRDADLCPVEMLKLGLRVSYPRPVGKLEWEERCLE